MVVKPPRPPAGRVQPGVKVRGREHPRIIYGPDHTEPDQMNGLRHRFLGKKRSVTPPLPEESGFSLSSAEVGDGQALPVSNRRTISGERFPRRVSPAVSSLDSMALREFALGLEALSRLAEGEPLWRVHEPVFAVLALESEPVDPRL